MCEIRLGSIEDIQGIQELLNRKIQWLKKKGINQWQFGYADKYDYNYFKEQINKGNKILLAKQDNKIVSFLMLSESSEYFEDTTESYYIRHFTSESMFVGQKLLKEAYRIALKDNKKWIRGDCTNELSQLVNYYKRFGAVICGKGVSENGYYKYYLLERTVSEVSEVSN